MTMSYDEMTAHEVKQKNTAGLAYLGDAVFELMVREYLLANTDLQPEYLHKTAISFVCAKAQREAVEAIKSSLSPEEEAVMRRGKNTSKMTLPRGSAPRDYRAATGLETLFG